MPIQYKLQIMLRITKFQSWVVSIEIIKFEMKNSQIEGGRLLYLTKLAMATLS